MNDKRTTAIQFDLSIYDLFFCEPSDLIMEIILGTA